MPVGTATICVTQCLNFGLCLLRCAGLSTTMRKDEVKGKKNHAGCHKAVASTAVQKLRLPL